MRVATLIPTCAGREENLQVVLQALADQTVRPEAVVIVHDGGGRADVPAPLAMQTTEIEVPKHEPGMEQPRNIGVRLLERNTLATHVWFLDSDVVPDPHALAEIYHAYAQGPEDRVMVCPYDWLDAGDRHPFTQGWAELRNDPRRPSFDAYQPDEVLTGDLAAGLACFSGNLVWPIDEFQRVGGFWSEIHHGRCEDGELGLRAVAMDVKISFQSRARGWHLWHPVNMDLALARNTRDVPMLNARHPWVEGSDVFMVDRDGKAFDVRCRCGKQVPTIGWWEHASRCVGLAIPVSTEGGTDGQAQGAVEAS